MINSSFIHETDDMFFFNESVNEDNSMITEYIGNLFTLESKYEDAIMFNEDIDPSYYSEGVTDFLGKIGDKIKEIVEKCIKFISDKIEAFEHYLWKRKTKDGMSKVLKDVEKKRPDLVDKLRVYVAEDKLSANDFKDLKNFYASIDDVLRNIEKMDNKTVKAKMLNAEDVINRTTKVIGIITASTAAIAGIKKTADIVIDWKGARKCASASDNGDLLNEIEKMKESAKTVGMHLTKFQVRNGKIEGYTVEAEDVKSSKDIAHARETQQKLAVVANTYSKVTSSVISKRVNATKACIDIVNKFAKGGGSND